MSENKTLIGHVSDASGAQPRGKDDGNKETPRMADGSEIRSGGAVASPQDATAVLTSATIEQPRPRSTSQGFTAPSRPNDMTAVQASVLPSGTSPPTGPQHSVASGTPAAGRPAVGPSPAAAVATAISQPRSKRSSVAPSMAQTNRSS